MNNEILSVVTADDSPTVRALLRQWLVPEHGFRIVGEAPDGRKAVELTLKLRPSVVVMDVDMPGMDGVNATREIMCRQPTPIMIFTSLRLDPQRGVSFEALAAGALEIFQKPRLMTGADADAAADRFRRLLRLLAPIKLIRHCALRPSEGEKAAADSGAAREVLALAASTGGPPALVSVLGSLPPAAAPGVLLVQHMAPEFMDGFVEWLSGSIKLPVRVAAQGDQPRPGLVLAAPGDRHMRLGRDGRILLDDSPPVNSCRPSADILFESVAGACGPRAIGAVLTGMGEDGARGLLCMRKSGALTIAQDEASSAVYGMPKAAADLGAAGHILGLGEIGKFIAARSAPGRPS